MLDSGLTVEQIIKSQVDEYGETVLSAPTKFGFNLTAWVMPFMALIAGGVGIRKILYTWVGKNSLKMFRASLKKNLQHLENIPNDCKMN